jgi:hypothetical protein
VDAEVDAGNEDQYQGFANAWKGGPKSEQLGRDKISSPNQPPVAMMKAYELLSNPEVQAVAAKARSHPKVKEAVLACMGDPTKFGAYLDDNDIGPILRELKSSIEEQ